MRGRLAAACAAVLVGLAPAGALPFASYAAAASCQSFGDTILKSDARRSAPPAGTELRRVSPDLPERQALPAASLAIWRSPSGPAPSRAPPA